MVTEGCDISIAPCGLFLPRNLSLRRVCVILIIIHDTIRMLEMVPLTLSPSTGRGLSRAGLGSGSERVGMYAPSNFAMGLGRLSLVVVFTWKFVTKLSITDNIRRPVS